MDTVAGMKRCLLSTACRALTRGAMPNYKFQLPNCSESEFGIHNRQFLESTIGPASKLNVDDSVDDSIVREIEKNGFIDLLYS
jgi:hypothetical protein